MMSVLGYRFELRHVLPALASLICVACANVLGVEDRALDTAANYPASGYEGCRPAGTCSACLDVHRAECEARAYCADTSQLGECASCVCDNCAESVTDCRLDAGCDAIWQCLQQSRCDLSEGVPGNCRQTCGAVIEANGGVSGNSFRDAAAIRTCAITQSCWSCLPPERDVPPATCTPQDGCIGCGDCFTQCLCSGDTFSVCQDLCGDAPPDACSEEDFCAGCTSCFQVCSCQGGTFADCRAGCQEEPPACELADDCNGCSNCVEQCVCEGGDNFACQESCEPPPASDVCEEGSKGSGTTCGGCSSCLASCTCDGTGLESCMATCNMLDCCEGVGCPSFYYDCVCATTESSEDCAEDNYSCNVTGCDECTCNNCIDKYSVCQDVAGCSGAFECMRATNCQGSECLERCGDATEQSLSSDAFAIAEALRACDRAAGCTCDNQSGGGGHADCSGVQCEPYVGNNVSFDACCPGAMGDMSGQGAAAPVAAADACGLNLKPYFRAAPSCLPLNQPQEPPILSGLLTGCNNGRVQEPPYNNATLRACCRDKGLCGYWDDITGLGCIDPAIFGHASGDTCN